MATKNEASPTTRIRLVYCPDSTDDLMHRANAHLSTRQPYQALPLYTKILSSSFPGHPCAFLNRSLAYLALDYPELAVADAYRAAMSSYGMRKSSTLPGDRMLKAVAKYTRSENLAKQSGEPWATEPTCYPGPAWLRVPLAAIFLDVDQIRLESSARQSVCMVLELKAIYRMAYALWQCGGGALSDALGLLCDAKASYKLTSEEEFSIVSLGNEIMSEIDGAMTSDGRDMQEQSEIDPSYQRPANAGKEKGFGVRDVMRRRYAWVKREVYPWNKHQPDLTDPSVVETLNRATDDISLGSQLGLLPLEPGRVPRLALFSTGDIEPGSTLLTEVSSLQVTNTSTGQTTSMYCNNCAALLIAPATASGIKERGSRSTNPLGDAFSESSSTFKSTSDDEEDVAYFSQKKKIENGAALTPPGTPTTTPSYQHLPPDIKICPVCDQAPFCSRSCQEEAQSDYHRVLCASGVEEGICEAIQKHEAVAHHHINGEAEQIYELLLMRIFALAKEKGVHPLDLDEVCWLDGDFFAHLEINDEPQLDEQGGPVDSPLSQYPDMRCDASRKTLPWSFEANVVRPIKWLTKLGLKPIENIERCDGWIINTLLAKIMASTRITRGSRHAKMYDASGRLVTGPEADLRQHQQADSDGDVCVGSIHPIFSHVQCATNESDANVIVRDDGFVHCIARGGREGWKDTPPDMDVESMGISEQMSKYGRASSQGEDATRVIKAGSLIVRHAGAL